MRHTAITRQNMFCLAMCSYVPIQLFCMYICTDLPVCSLDNNFTYMTILYAYGKKAANVLEQFVDKVNRQAHMNMAAIASCLIHVQLDMLSPRSMASIVIENLRSCSLCYIIITKTFKIKSSLLTHNSYYVIRIKAS